MRIRIRRELLERLRLRNYNQNIMKGDKNMSEFVEVGGKRYEIGKIYKELCGTVGYLVEVTSGGFRLHDGDGHDTWITSQLYEVPPEKLGKIESCYEDGEWYLCEIGDRIRPLCYDKERLVFADGMEFSTYAIYADVSSLKVLGKMVLQDQF